MMSGKSSLYVISPRTFIILKNSNLVKSSLLLSLIIWINIIFVFSVHHKKYILFFSLRVSPQTLFLLVNFFIFLLKKVLFCQSSSYNL